MEPFQLTVTLETPLALGRTYLTLDAVLFGILKDMQEFGTSSLDPIEGVPLHRQNGLFYATQAEFELPVEGQEVKIGGIRPVTDMADASDFIRSPRSRMSKVVTTAGHTKAHLSRYRNIACEAVTWRACGDPDRVAALMNSVGNIGALRKDGHGQIGSVACVEIDDANILVDERGFVTRPVPVSVARDLKLQTVSLTSIESWKPPYWDDANKTECYLPA